MYANGEDAGRAGKFFVEEQENFLKGGMVEFSQILLLWFISAKLGGFKMEREILRTSKPMRDADDWIHVCSSKSVSLNWM